MKVHETGDYSYLLYKKKTINAKEKLFLKKIWFQLYDEYIKMFGFSENFKNIFKKQKEIALLKVRKIVTGDKIYQTFIEIAEIEFQKLLKANSSNYDFFEMKAIMQKYLGFVIDVHKTSVSEYYSYIKLINKIK